MEFQSLSLSPQINPALFVNENYYEVDGVLTTKLEQVDITSKKKREMKCENEADAVIGKDKVHYLKHAAFCLETQKFPDAVHHVSFDWASLNFNNLKVFFISHSPTSLRSSSSLVNSITTKSHSNLEMNKNCLVYNLRAYHS